jgi:hypothetical protein
VQAEAEQPAPAAGEADEGNSSPRRGWWQRTFGE